jgi:hypothetical protein
MKLPDNVEPMLILGNDNDYLTVYTYLTNEDAIELLKRSLEVLQQEQEQEADGGRQLH